MKDRIVEEIRSRRRKLMREKYHGSAEKLVHEAIEWARQHPERVIHARRKQAVAV
jgi:hypothetical protein